MSNDFTRERIGFGELWIPAVLALVMAVNYNLFIFPNAFAPAGINGIATMIQYLFHISIGYLSLLINVPLLIMAWNHV
ncbi:MAG: YitT family protein, partial [Firmicutes bacterium]|nr:YitT family protein [Bacillota bacterium]